MKTRVAAFTAILAATALAVAAPAGASSRADTGVTIKGPGNVFGYVLSERSSCEVGRIVRVYKQVGKTQNPAADTNMAHTTSERQGNKGVWDLGNPGFPHGKYYAMARKTPKCAPGFSKTVKF
jgi:hypothetical protein